MSVILYFTQLLINWHNNFYLLQISPKMYAYRGDMSMFEVIM